MTKSKVDLGFTYHPLNYYFPFKVTPPEEADYFRAHRVFPTLSSKYPKETAVLMRSVRTLHPKKYTSSNPALKYRESLILRALKKLVIVDQSLDVSTQIPHFFVTVLKHPPTLHWVLKHGAVVDPSEYSLCDRRTQYDPSTPRYCKDCLDNTAHILVKCVRHRSVKSVKHHG